MLWGVLCCAVLWRSVGINLTAANYVFIMEPALNPALEVGG